MKSKKIKSKEEVAKERLKDMMAECKCCGEKLGMQQDDWPESSVWLAFDGRFEEENKPFIFCSAECVAKWFGEEIEDVEDVLQHI